jgi:hypothetical protein
MSGVDDGAKRTITIPVGDAAGVYLLVVDKAPAEDAYSVMSETNITF